MFLSMVDFLTKIVIPFRLLSPLHVAADKAHYDVMDVLLKHGAKVSINV